MPLEVKFAFLTALGITLLISIYIYNLGLASRMRLMIVPYVIYGVHTIMKKRDIIS